MTDTISLDPAPTKPGWRTTEFWLSTAAKILGILFASGIIGTGTTAERIAGIAAALLATMGYTVSRGLVKAAAAVIVLGLFVAPHLACTKAQRTEAGHAVVDCTAANEAAIAKLATSMRAPTADGGCLTPTGTDWSCVRSKAIAAGVMTGGCAFLELVSAEATPAARVSSATGEPPPERPGRAAFESYRASVAGGAAFRTAAGDR